MSDLYVSAGLDVNPTDVCAGLRWLPSTNAWAGDCGGLTWVAARVDNPTLWSPARDPASQTQAIVAGRFAFDESEWASAERLPYQGGLAARLLLDRWLQGGAQAVQQLNGAGVAVIMDERARELHVWTDRMGFYPLFAWQGTGFLVCSHPDIAANALATAGRPCAFDAVTMAEFMQTGTATQPHSYWRGIDQCEAGTYYHFSWGDEARLKNQTIYWRPAYFDEPYLEDRRKIVDQLEAALSGAVAKRTLSRLGHTVVLLSAGADSRAVLFGARNPSELTCLTLYDDPNEELFGAQNLAAAANAAHIKIRRDPDYYIDHAAQAVRLSGGMWSIESAHYGGLIDYFREAQVDSVLTGCYADYLLKGLAYNRQAKRILGRDIPLYELTDFDYEFYLPFAQIEPEWSAKVQERLEARFAPVNSAGIRTCSVAEYLRLSPIAREGDAAGRLTLRRMSGHDFFLADSEVLELFGRMAPGEKLNGIPFGMAVANIVGKRGSKVPNNNYGATVGASETQRVGEFIAASLRRKVLRKGSGHPFERNPSSVATAGSWPYMPRIIKLSDQLRDWCRSQPADQREFISGVIGSERLGWSVDDWAVRDATLFVRYYSASLWLSQNPVALRRVAHD
ncbi:MAG: asparagine synthase-related protein [Pseudomonadota bacterium]